LIATISPWNEIPGLYSSHDLSVMPITKSMSKKHGHPSEEAPSGAERAERVVLKGSLVGKDLVFLFTFPAILFLRITPDSRTPSVPGGVADALSDRRQKTPIFILKMLSSGKMASFPLS